MVNSFFVTITEVVHRPFLVGLATDDVQCRYGSRGNGLRKLSAVGP